MAKVAVFTPCAASIFCLPKTGSALENTWMDLPGPGALSLRGSADLVP
jgi:hypothetical protein